MKIKNILNVLIRQHYPLSVTGHIFMLSPKNSDRCGTKVFFYNIAILSAYVRHHPYFGS